jgi:glutamate dehydrogenase/leucine dehydrogenase
MTLKYGFLGLPQGGAKAGVRGEPEGDPIERRQILERFGRAIAPLLRKQVYIPDTDMGTTNADIQYLLDSVGIRTKRRELRGAHSGYYTALTVLAGLSKRPIIWASLFLELPLQLKDLARWGAL